MTRLDSRLLALLVTSACATAPAYTPGTSTVLQGGQGIVVTMLEVAGPQGPQLLIQVDGSDSRINGKPLPYVRDASEPHLERYITQLNGKNAAVVQVTSGPAGEKQWWLSLPDTKTRVRISPQAASQVNATQMLERFEQLQADGTLAELRAFSREQQIAQHQAQLAKALEKTRAACGELTLQVEWDDISDEALRDARLPKVFTAPLHALRQLCQHPSAKGQINRHIKEITCRLGEMRAELQPGRLTWSANFESKNRESFAREYLLQHASWSDGSKLGQLVQLDETHLCRNEAGQYVGITTNPQSQITLFYGDPKTLRTVPPPPPPLPGNWFFEPRETAPEGPEQARIDARYYSRLNLKAQEGLCELRCGARTIPLVLVDREQTRAVMTSALREEPLPRRRPYAMARDRKGTYYFVDLSDSPAARDFRLLRGPKGNLQPLKMLNIVSDSHGDIFSTASGELRLVLEKEKSYWVEREQSYELINIPVRENWGMIYQDLGVYTATPLGTPCEVM